jgi:hypothetical protein
LLSQNNWSGGWNVCCTRKLSTSYYGVASDSLYKLSLNGSEGKFGFIKIADEYSGTDGNLANYYAGMAYLNTGKYNEAIDYLNKSDDIVL